jgi:CDP-glucose 4,6-dehydratase
MKNNLSFSNFKKYFKNKRIFITGNTGFVGSYISICLELMGAKILGYAIKKKDYRYLSNTIEYKKKIQTIYDDLININKHKNIIIKFKPQILIHLASQPLVSKSYLNTEKNYETNIMGTVKLLELTKELNFVKKILIFTSDKVYKNFDKGNLKENSELGGEDPYSASKSAQDIISNSYKHSFFEKNKNIFIVRAGNIIGGGDWEKSRLIPDLFISNHKKEKIYLRNPKATRPWQHILDLNYAIITLLFKKNKISKNSYIYNVGPKFGSNLDVKTLIKKFLNKSSLFNITPKFKKITFKEKKFLSLSSNSILQDLNWSPKLNIDDTVKITCDWYFYFFKSRKKNIYQFTKNQILNFFR